MTSRRPKSLVPKVARLWPHLDERARRLFAALTTDVWRDVVTHLGLSPRKSDVLLNVIRGDSEKHIARTVGPSVHTVHSHLLNAYRKLDVGNRTALACRALLTYIALLNR
jgi:DNA-binding NarL/FixJ family response regulator